MNIVLASDQYYLKPSKVLLKSVAANNPEPIDVYMLYSEIGPREQESFTADCAAFSDKLTVRFIAVDTDKYKTLPITNDLPLITYARCEAPSLLPETMERALYLDCDIIVNGSLRDFYETDFEGNLYVACEDAWLSVLGNQSYTMFGKLGKECEQGKYFNAGVLLINLAMARQMNIMRDVFQTGEKYADEIICNDQDILNFLYGGLTKYADYRRYNLHWGHVTPEEEASMFSNAAVIHYCGPQKPWLNIDKGDGVPATTRLWRSYADDLEQALHA